MDYDLYKGMWAGIDVLRSKQLANAQMSMERDMRERERKRQEDERATVLRLAKVLDPTFAPIIVADYQNWSQTHEKSYMVLGNDSRPPYPRLVYLAAKGMLDGTINLYGGEDAHTKQ